MLVIKLCLNFHLNMQNNSTRATLLFLNLIINNLQSVNQVCCMKQLGERSIDVYPCLHYLTFRRLVRTSDILLRNEFNFMVSNFCICRIFVEFPVLTEGILSSLSRIRLLTYHATPITDLNNDTQGFLEYSKFDILRTFKDNILATDVTI